MNPAPLDVMQEWPTPLDGKRSPVELGHSMPGSESKLNRSGSQEEERQPQPVRRRKGEV